jgi:hypothetical protein
MKQIMYGKLRVAELVNIFLHVLEDWEGGGGWGGVVSKALRYQSEGPGIDPRWCHW